QHAPVGDGDALEPPEGGPEAREAALDLLGRGAQLERERGRGDGVVDVVEPGHADLDATRPGGSIEPEGRARQTVELDLPGCHAQRGAAVTAGRAPVVAEVTDVR